MTVLSAFGQGTAPLYTVTVESGATKAIDYSAMGGSGKIGFRGTVLAPNATGSGKVKSQGGVMSIEAEFKGLEPATKYGPEYMTYVLWAISPEGRALNLGELMLKKGKGSMAVTTRLQSFALVVTAEPYFAVTQIGNVVVVENTLNEDNAKYEVPVNYEHLQRGQYSVNVEPADLKPVTMDKKVPLDYYQAGNAVKLAKSAGAEKYAPEALKKATDMYAQAQWNLTDKKGKKKVVPAMSRQVVQQAEDARQLAIKEQAVAKAAEEKRAMEAKAAAERQALEQKAAAEKQAMEQKVAAAQDSATSEAAQRKAAEQDVEKFRTQAATAEKEKAALRAQLRDQLNAVMSTTDSARGLIVSMTGLLFKTGKSDLLPPVREKLARVAGILLGHPGLKLEIEGHTDDVGAEDMNQTLSEKRAASVRDYLASQGVPADAMVSRGFGETKPMAPNDTAEGKTQNRRVEIVVSGDAIKAAGK
jgi:outer membrane protein OmpA-like peptidoglycan-associated protein